MQRQLHEVALLNKEVKMLIHERAKSLNVKGGAAVLVANSDAESFPEVAMNPAKVLWDVNTQLEETLVDAQSLQAEAG